MSRRVFLYDLHFRFFGQSGLEPGYDWDEELLEIGPFPCGIYEVSEGPRKSTQYCRIVDDNRFSDCPGRRETWLRLGGPTVEFVDPRVEFAKAPLREQQGGDNE